MADTSFFDLYTEEHFRFSPDEIALLLQGFDSYTVKKSEAIYNAGEDVSQIYYLKKGTAKYHMIYPDGSSQTVAYSKASSFLGIINWLPLHQTINYCTAVTSCEIVICPLEQLLARLREHNLMEKMLLFVLGASRHAYSNLTTLLANDRVQLVDVLRNHQKLTLQETADFIGCSRVQVSRICKKLKDEREGS